MTDNTVFKLQIASSPLDFFEVGLNIQDAKKLNVTAASFVEVRF